MAYSAGDTILDDEYNNFVNGSSSPYGINYIAGTGTGNVGLGQTEIATTSAGTTITAAQWNSLFTLMNNVANHTNDTITSTTARTAGDPIAAIAALSTDLATLQASVQGGCANVTEGAGQGTTEGSEDLSLVASGVFDKSHVVEASFTFDGGDEARWFFNAGGKLRVKITNAATNSTSIDTSYNALISALGNFDMGATTNTRSGTGETLGGDQNLGYYDLTTGYQTLMTITQDDGTYSGAHSITIEGKTSAAHADGRGNNGEVVTLKVSIATTEISPATDDYTTGNLASQIVEANAGGPTDVAFHTVDPTTSEGLSVVYTNIVVAEVLNSTTNLD